MKKKLSKHTAKNSQGGISVLNPLTYSCGCQKIQGKKLCPEHGRS